MDIAANLLKFVDGLFAKENGGLGVVVGAPEHHQAAQSDAFIEGLFHLVIQGESLAEGFESLVLVAQRFVADTHRVQRGGLGQRASRLLRQGQSLLQEIEAFLRIAAIDVDIGHIVQRDALVFEIADLLE